MYLGALCCIEAHSIWNVISFQAEVLRDAECGGLWQNMAEHLGTAACTRLDVFSSRQVRQCR